MLMEDRRIKKTKKNLKQTLIEMLADMPFEQITVKKIAGFLCYGMVGLINEGHSENMDRAELHKEARRLLTGILKSDILAGKN